MSEVAQLDKETQELIHQWNGLVNDIKEAKATEMKIRKQLSEKLFPEANLGVNTLELGHGFQLKFTKKETITIDEAALSALKFPKGTLDKTVIFAPKFSAAGYKHLPEKHQKTLQEAMIIKPASPSLVFVEPKEDK